MKIVAVADCHLHPHKVCSNNNGADRLRDGLGALRWSLQLAEREGATWVMAGDFKLPKTSWPQEALTGAHAILREFRDAVPMVMVAGNHDGIGLGGSGLAPFKDVATVVEDKAEQVGNLLCVPFGADLAQVKTNKHLPVIAHAFVKGVYVGPDNIRLPGWEKAVDVSDYGQFPVAVFGDIHKGQVRLPPNPSAGRAARWEPYASPGPLRAKGRWEGELYYPGSMYQQNWGERNDPPKGALLIDLTSGSVELREADAPKFVQIELLDCEALPAALLEAQGNNFVRVVTEAARWTQQAIEARKLQFRWLQVVERKSPPKSQKRAVIHAGMSRQELLESYVKARPPQGLDPGQTLEAGRRLWGSE